MPAPEDATPQQLLADDDASARRSPLNQPRGPDNRPLEDGVGLSLSRGGYRAMLFHLGTLWRLYEAGLLKPLARISSVSGARSLRPCSACAGRS